MSFIVAESQLEEEQDKHIYDPQIIAFEKQNRKRLEENQVKFILVINIVTLGAFLFSTVSSQWLVVRFNKDQYFQVCLHSIYKCPDSRCEGVLQPMDFNSKNTSSYNYDYHLLSVRVSGMLTLLIYIAGTIYIYIYILGLVL